MKKIKLFEEFTNEAESKRLKFTADEMKQLDDLIPYGHMDKSMMEYEFKPQDAPGLLCKYSDGYEFSFLNERSGEMKLAFKSKKWDDIVKYIEADFMSKSKTKLMEARSVDIAYALKAIKEYNRKSSEYMNDEKDLDELAETVVKHLGFKATPKNIQIAGDHLSASSGGGHNRGIPEDTDVVGELIPMLEY